MVQRTYSCNTLNKVSYRDLPYVYGTNSIMNKNNRDGSEAVSFTNETGQNLIGSGCNNGIASVADQRYNRPKEDESLELTMKKAGLNLATNCNVGSRRLLSTKRNFTLNFGSKVKLLDSEESIALYSSQSRREQQLSLSSSSIQRKPWRYVQKRRDSPVKKKNLRNVAPLREKIHKPTQHRDERLSNQGKHISVMQQKKVFKFLTLREKVLEVARHFKNVFEKLDRDKPAPGRSKYAASRIDFRTRARLVKMGMQVNTKKMIGPVPGIKVGDKFQFKSVLNLIGLHFNIRGGIDYMKEGDLKLATSIVSAECNGYNDRFDPNVMIYYGQGGNVISKDYKLIEDQKLEKGNLALANNIKAKTPVRVILGKRRMDRRGKDYVYDGLYMVEDYCKEKGHGGKIVFKFKLRRVSA